MIPSALKISFPRNMNPTEIARAVPIPSSACCWRRFGIDVRAEPDEDRHHPDGVDRDEDRDEGDDKLGGEIFHRERPESWSVEDRINDYRMIALSTFPHLHNVERVHQSIL